ncbi:hypothetical protein D3C77_330320 [compost metagenome]
MPRNVRHVLLQPVAQLFAKRFERGVLLDGGVGIMRVIQCHDLGIRYARLLQADQHQAGQLDVP